MAKLEGIIYKVFDGSVVLRGFFPLNKENKDVNRLVGFNLLNFSQLQFKDYDQLVDGLITRLEKHYEV